MHYFTSLLMLSVCNYGSTVYSSEPYLEVYSNLYYFLAQSEEMNATDKWPGFVLTKEGEEFVQQNANLFKYDLLYNPLRFESWQRLANIYDEARFTFVYHFKMYDVQTIKTLLFFGFYIFLARDHFLYKILLGFL